MKKYIVSVTRFVWSAVTSLFQQKSDISDDQPDVMRRMVLAGAVATVVVGLVGATMFASPAHAQHYRRRSRRWRRRHRYGRSRRRHLYRRSRRRHLYRRSRRRRHYYGRSRPRYHSYRRSRRRHSYRRSRRRHSYRRSRWY